MIIACIYWILLSTGLSASWTLVYQIHKTPYEMNTLRRKEKKMDANPISFTYNSVALGKLFNYQDIFVIFIMEKIIFK